MALMSSWLILSTLLGPIKSLQPWIGNRPLSGVKRRTDFCAILIAPCFKS